MLAHPPNHQAHHAPSSAPSWRRLLGGLLEPATRAHKARDKPAHARLKTAISTRINARGGQDSTQAHARAAQSRSGYACAQEPPQPHKPRSNQGETEVRRKQTEVRRKRRGSSLMSTRLHCFSPRKQQFRQAPRPPEMLGLRGPIRGAPPPAGLLSPSPRADLPRPPPDHPDHRYGPGSRSCRALHGCPPRQAGWPSRRLLTRSSTPALAVTG